MNGAWKIYIWKRKRLYIGREVNFPNGGYTVDKRVQDIYENAEWMLKPTEDTYHIWMDEYVESLERTIEPVEMFRLVDQTTGTEFIVRLEDIIMITDGWKSQKEVELWSEKKESLFYVESFIF